MKASSSTRNWTVSVSSRRFSGFSRMNRMHRDENAARTLGIIRSYTAETRRHIRAFTQVSCISTSRGFGTKRSGRDKHSPSHSQKFRQCAFEPSW